MRECPGSPTTGRVFRPRYKASLWFGALTVAIVSLALVAVGMTDDMPFWAELSAALCLVMLFAMPLALIREIRFLERIHIIRPLLPHQSFGYAEVEDIGQKGIVLPGTYIDLSFMKNAGELRDILQQCLQSGRIREGQLAGVQKRAEKAGERATLVAAVIAGIVVAALKATDSQLSYGTEKLVEGGVSLAVVVLVFAVVYPRSSAQRESRKGTERAMREPRKMLRPNAVPSVKSIEPRRLAAWVGSNWSTHYARSFQYVLGGKRWSWNWAAALFPPWWVYRRQYATFIALAAFHVMATRTMRGADEQWSGWNFAMLALGVGIAVTLGCSGDRIVFRRARAYLSTEGSNASVDEITAHGRPNLPLAVVAAALWAWSLILP